MASTDWASLKKTADTAPASEFTPLPVGPYDVQLETAEVKTTGGG